MAKIIGPFRESQAPSWLSGPMYPLSQALRIVYSSIFQSIYTKDEFEDNKGVIRIRISKKNRQHNGQKKKYKRTNNDLQNINIKKVT